MFNLSNLETVNVMLASISYQWDSVNIAWTPCHISFASVLTSQNNPCELLNYHIVGVSMYMVFLPSKLSIIRVKITHLLVAGTCLTVMVLIANLKVAIVKRNTANDKKIY